MKVLEKNYSIRAPIEKVWEALTVPSSIERWGAGPEVVMDSQPGGEFKLWEGSIWGRNIELVPNSRLVQEWYTDGWTKPSFVTFDLEQIEDTTLVTLKHKDIPEGELDSINHGWDEYYMGPLRDMVETFGQN